MADVTIKDIAEQLGISSATVSLALNNRPGVNPQTKQKVMELVQKLNYTGTAVNKVHKNKGVLNFLVYKRCGKIIADTQFFADLIEAVETAARSFDYMIALTYCNGKDQLDSILKPVLSAQPEGIIILGTEMTEDDLQFFSEVDIPILILDGDLLDCSVDRVTIHNTEGIWQAVKHLYEQGHREIGYLKSSFSIKNFDQRFWGYRYALKKLELSYQKEYVFVVEPTLDGALNDVDILVKNNMKLPTALVADNDLLALGALKAFKQNGIKVPEDISIIGFDDIPMCLFFEPALTSVRVSTRALGYSAVQHMISRIDNLNMDEAFMKISIGTTLMVRDSVKKINI